MSLTNSGINLRIEKKRQLKRNRQFDEYKKQRSYVLTQVEKAKRKYFSQLVNDKTNVSSIWKAINTLTHKTGATIHQPLISHLTALTTIFFHYPADYFSHSWETLILMDMSVLLPCLTSAGKGVDPPIHSTYSRAHMHHVVGNFESKADVRRPYFRR